MKLRCWGTSYNGNKLEADQFAYVIGPLSLNPTSEIREIVIPCRGGKFSNCVVRIHRSDPDAGQHIWHWDGNVEEPTLTPSIGCDHRCGWHGQLTKGELLP